MKPNHLALIALAIVTSIVGSGCSTMSGGSAASTQSFLTTAATTSAGAYIGAKQGKPQDAVIGAAAGYTVGEAIDYLSDKSKREAYLAGYEKGQSNAVKQQYWIARDNQRPRPGNDGYEESLYAIPIPASDQNGVQREATTRVIRVVAPKEDTNP
jgi:hypothetical protein